MGTVEEETEVSSGGFGALIGKGTSSYRIASSNDDDEYTQRFCGIDGSVS